MSTNDGEDDWIEIDKPEKLQPKKKANPNKAPEDRVSATGNKFPGSPESEWEEYIGIGLIHVSDTDWVYTNFRRCCVTGRWHRKNQTVLTIKGTYVSRAEFRKNWMLDQFAKAAFLKSDKFSGVACDHDGNVIDVSNGTIRGKFIKCDWTGNYYPNGCIRQISGRSQYKYVCCRITDTGEVFRKCERCAILFENFELVRFGDPDQLYCPTCLVLMQDRGIIQEYDSKEYPPPLISSNPVMRRAGRDIAMVRKQLSGDGSVHTTVTRSRLYGVECECELASTLPALRPAAIAREIISVLGSDFVIVKKDGSLTNGFEIVTAPADIDSHRERWPRISSAPSFEKLRSWDTETCGMHVHVEKESLTTLQVGRILVFINATKNYELIKRCAGRSSDRFSRVLPKKLTDSLRYDSDKYVAVNTKHEDTIEFRIFRGTINHRHIIRNIEFVDAVCNFCHPASRSLRELDSGPADFLNYCRSNRRQYPELVRWMEADKIGLLPMRNEYGPKDLRGAIRPSIDELAPAFALDVAF